MHASCRNYLPYTRNFFLRSDATLRAHARGRGIPTGPKGRTSASRAPESVSEHAFDRAFVRIVISPRDVCIPKKSIQAPPLLQFITNTCPGLLPFLLREVWRDDPVSKVQKTEQPRWPGGGDGDSDGDRNDDGDGGKGGRIHSWNLGWLSHQDEAANFGRSLPGRAISCHRQPE